MKKYLFISLISFLVIPLIAQKGSYSILVEPVSWLNDGHKILGIYNFTENSAFQIGYSGATPGNRGLAIVPNEETNIESKYSGNGFHFGYERQFRKTQNSEWIFNPYLTYANLAFSQDFSGRKLFENLVQVDILSEKANVYGMNLSIGRNQYFKLNNKLDFKLGSLIGMTTEFKDRHIINEFGHCGNIDDPGTIDYTSNEKSILFRPTVLIRLGVRFRK
jgi:hypothetical protein